MEEECFEGVYWVEIGDQRKLGINEPACDAMLMHQMNAHERAYRRLFALLLTLLIELLVAFVISRFTNTLQTYPLLMSFMPVISAVSGNVGLQSSSIITRALALGIVSVPQASRAILREIEAALILGLTLGCITGLIAGIWQEWIVFGMIVGISQFLSILTAAFTGSAAPLIGKYFQFDPATIAGPMETAIQDVVGNSLFLIFATSLLQYFTFPSMKQAHRDNNFNESWTMDASSLVLTFLCLCVFAILRVAQQKRSPTTWMQAFTTPMTLCIPLHTTQEALFKEYKESTFVPDVILDPVKPRLLHKFIVSPILQCVVWWEQRHAISIDISDLVMSPLLFLLSWLLPKPKNIRNQSATTA
ncbi:magnesium transporter [Thraustotheca clavata]|uniref:Magnesium transporter n=1 Tax=Thraustotheca clavata TaxID=74557 RepID=A0A1V9YTL6_9STRA|nr:magnesium transporter [Thraustotheca clavata]